MLRAISIKGPGFREINGDVYTAGLIHLAVFPEFHILRLSPRRYFTPSGQIELNAWHLSAFKTQWPDGNNDGDQRKEQRQSDTGEGKRRKNRQCETVAHVNLLRSVGFLWYLAMGFINVYQHISHTPDSAWPCPFMGNNWATKIDDQNYITKRCIKGCTVLLSVLPFLQNALWDVRLWNSNKCKQVRLWLFNEDFIFLQKPSSP